MMRGGNYRFTIDGQTFRGNADRLIRDLEARGEQAILDENSPDIYWNYSEYLKKEKNNETESKNHPVDTGRRRYSHRHAHKRPVVQQDCRRLETPEF